MKIIDIDNNGLEGCYETAVTIGKRMGLNVHYGSLFHWNPNLKRFTLDFTHHCYCTDDNGQIYDAIKDIDQLANKRLVKDWNVLKFKWTKNNFPPFEIVTRRWNTIYKKYDAIYLEGYVPPHVKTPKNIPKGEMAGLPPKERLINLKNN